MHPCLLYPPPSPPPPLSPPQPPSHPMCAADIDIHVLNNRADLDFFTSYNLIYRDHLIDDDPYFAVNLQGADNKLGQFLSQDI